MAKKMKKGILAPDFLLKDTEGKEVSLAQFRGGKFVVLVLNRGFV